MTNFASKRLDLTRDCRLLSQSSVVVIGSIICSSCSNIAQTDSPLRESHPKSQIFADLVANASVFPKSDNMP